MPAAATAHSFAVLSIQALFWWTVLSPLGLLAVALLCARRLVPRLALSIVVIVPPLLVLLPVAVMHGGADRLMTVAAILTEAAALVLAVAGLLRRRTRPEHAARTADLTLVVGAAGGMLGSAALLVPLLAG